MMTTTYYNEAAFFDAWQKGVRIAGPLYFGDGTAANVDRAKSKYDLAPDYDAVESALGTLSSGEAVFLAAMYSFYNDNAGGKMLAQLDAPGLAGISAHLDEPRCRVIADLLVSYAGW